MRMIRVGNVIQLVFSNKFDARIYYTDASSTFKSVQDRYRKDHP